jgi:hypothetical protein
MSETIGLGGRRFELRPLKLGQLRHLLDALEEMTGKSGGGLIDAAAKVVAAGLQPAHPDLGTEAVLELEAGIDELNAAVAAILRIAGLQPAERAPGETEPVASPGIVLGSSSAPSTAPSPPAAATPIR